jgi:hypothetical protein
VFGCDAVPGTTYYFNTNANLQHSTDIYWSAYVWTENGCIQANNVNYYALGSMRVTGTLQYFFTLDQTWSNCVNGVWGYNNTYRYYAAMPFQHATLNGPCGHAAYRTRLLVQTKSGTLWTTRVTLYTSSHTFG